jgi:ATP synthase subunit 6
MFTCLIFSPLEQFAVVSGFAWGGSLFNFFFFTNYSVMLCLVFLFWVLLGITLFHTRRPLLVSSVMFLFAQYFLFCVTFVKENLSKKAYYFFPYLFVLFTFLLTANLFSLVPYSFAITSHISVTLFLSFLTFFTCVILCFYRHGLDFFSLFLPSGAPLPLIPLLVVLEMISFIARLFSLAIRLFANIMSGHTLLNILAGFGWILATKLSLIFFFPVAVVFLVSFLEVGISILQAYVFCVLSAIYLYEALFLH